MKSKKFVLSEDKASDPTAAMDTLVRLLATRERSVQESTQRLKDKGYQEEAILEATRRALSCGLLDDQRFAQNYIKDKTLSGWGPRRIEERLYFFGISKEDIEGYPESYYDFDTQITQATKALSCHRSRSKNPRQAAYRYLVNKGYDGEVAHTAIQRSSLST